MKPDQYENNAEGILCVYKNPKWLVCIKNWKPDNDIAGIAHLEIHHSTDEQFILAAGKAILITAEREGGSFKNIELTPMQQGKVYNVPAECWFYSITQKDTQGDLCAGLQLLYGKQRPCRPDRCSDRRHSGACTQDPRRVKRSFLCRSDASSLTLTA